MSKPPCVCTEQAQGGFSVIHFLELVGTYTAERAFVILGQLVSLVNVPANRANVFRHTCITPIDKQIEHNMPKPVFCAFSHIGFDFL